MIAARESRVEEHVEHAAVSRGRVVVADDDVLVREGVISLLQRSGFEVVGQAGDAAQLLDLVGEHLPDLAIIDIRMPPTHRTEGLAAARHIRQEFSDIGIVLLSAYVEVNDAMELLASCERVGYLLKSRVTDVDEFIDTLERIMKGGSVVDPSLVMELLDARRRNDPLAVLSDREREVLGSDGRGEVEHRNRPRIVGHRDHCSKARPTHPRQVGACRELGRSPSCPGGSRLAQGPLARPPRSSNSRTARAEREDLEMNPSAGLASMRRPKSDSEYVEMRMILRPSWDEPADGQAA